jgi:hypothetical protein
MTIIQHFFAEGKYLGQSERHLERVHEQVQVPHSYAFFCQTCAEVWARCPVEHNGQTQSFMVWSVNCRKHKISWRPAGSLVLDWDKGFWEAFPEEVVWRELNLHLDFAMEKGMDL